MSLVFSVGALYSCKGAWLVATNDRGTGRCQRDGSRANSLGPCFEPRAFRLPADRHQVAAFQKNTVVYFLSTKVNRTGSIGGLLATSLALGGGPMKLFEFP